MNSTSGSQDEIHSSAEGRQGLCIIFWTRLNHILRARARLSNEIWPLCATQAVQWGWILAANPPAGKSPGTGEVTAGVKLVQSSPAPAALSTLGAGGMSGR